MSKARPALEYFTRREEVQSFLDTLTVILLVIKMTEKAPQVMFFF
jgi:hypothetical protein